MLPVAGDTAWLGDGTCPESFTQFVIQVREIGVLKTLPRGQRDIIPFGRELVVDDTSLAQRAAVYIDSPGHTVGPGIYGPMDNGASAGMTHQDHRIINGVYGSDDGVNMVAEADAGSWCIL
jgi:hypothetical protein